jgi:hypothetical protein
MRMMDNVKKKKKKEEEILQFCLRFYKFILLQIFGLINL